MPRDRHLVGGRIIKALRHIVTAAANAKGAILAIAVVSALSIVPTFASSASDASAGAGSPNEAGRRGTAGQIAIGQIEPGQIAGATPEQLFSGGLYVQENSQAANAAASLGAQHKTADASAIQQIASKPLAIWLGDWLSDTQLVTLLQTTTAASAKTGTTPVFVTYAIPGRDCGGYSAGGMADTSYASWNALIAQTLRGHHAVVLVEPDSLAQLSTCPQEENRRIPLIRHAAETLSAAGVTTYLDGGNSNWVQPDVMAERLAAAGVASTRGFFTNVANFYPLAQENAYAATLSGRLGGAHYVVDVSRNGRGWTGTWCNPPGAGLGEAPRITDGATPLDAILWVKTPGESDGTCNGGPSAGQWWESYALALVSRVAPGPTSTPVAAPLPAVTRLAGVDRSATSAAVSTSFPAGSPVAYIASGAAFPDALSGAATAGRTRGPILLVQPTIIPSVVSTELVRLKPGRIVVLGGTASVSDSVQTQLQAYTRGAVSRLAGPDRYATSAAISATFSTGPPVAYVATGSDFPDAVSGAALAATAEGGPMLLVAGTSIPSVIAEELTRLAPTRIVILGGTASVSNSVQRQLQAYTAGSVSRLAGPDRYATSATISATAGPGIDVAYIAAGHDFPDALSGAPAAGIARGRVLLVTTNAIPMSVATELTRLRPAHIVILGGTSTVSAGVENALRQYLR